MNLDSNGLPAVINEIGFDYGDSLANYCRWQLALIALGHPVNLASFPKLVQFPEGQLMRHPGSGTNPDGSSIALTAAPFWSDPKQVSRDNSRACHWLVALSTSEESFTDEAFAALQLVGLEYSQRGWKAQNGDVMAPFQLAKSGYKVFLRDLEIFGSVLVQIGLIPIFKHDKPWGFGKGKKITFTWLDSDEVDGEPNLTADLVGSKLVKDTLFSKVNRYLYRKLRGAASVRHYYRKESGNNPEIAELYSSALDLR